MLTRVVLGSRHVVILGFCAVISGGLVSADELTELKTEVKQQNEEITTLEDRVRQLEVQDEEPVSKQVVDVIDERIIAFENHPSSKLSISGYGAAGYTDPDSADGTFGMLFVPIFHYQLSERLHLTGEVEFDLRGDEVEVAPEYAQIDFLVNDYLTVTSGKFLLPFNAFSERIHPAWINKLPSLPPIYGSHGSGGGIVPVLSDLGIQLRGGMRLPKLLGDEAPRINYAFYVVNGPRIEPGAEADERFEELAGFLEDDGAITSADDLLTALEIGHEEGTEVEFGENFSDNNKNKAVGGRFGVLPIPALEFGGSFMWGRFDKSSDLDLRMYGFDGSYKIGPVDLRAEYIRLEFQRKTGGTKSIDGFYTQAAIGLREVFASTDMQAGSVLDRTELVFRYGRVDNGIEYGELTPGIVYWIRPSVPLKFAYSFRDGDRKDDELRLQLAFGF